MIGAVIGGISGALEAKSKGNNTLKGFMVGAVFGGFNGFFAFESAFALIVGSYFLGVAEDLTYQAVVDEKDDLDYISSIKSGVENVVFNKVGKSVSGLATIGGVELKNSIQFVSDLVFTPSIEIMNYAASEIIGDHIGNNFTYTVSDLTRDTKNIGVYN